MARWGMLCTMFSGNKASNLKAWSWCREYADDGYKHIIMAAAFGQSCWSTANNNACSKKPWRINQSKPRWIAAWLSACWWNCSTSHCLNKLCKRYAVCLSSTGLTNKPSANSSSIIFCPVWMTSMASKIAPLNCCNGLTTNKACCCWWLNCWNTSSNKNPFSKPSGETAAVAWLCEPCLMDKPINWIAAAQPSVLVWMCSACWAVTFMASFSNKKSATCSGGIISSSRNITWANNFDTRLGMLNCGMARLVITTCNQLGR